LDEERWDRRGRLEGGRSAEKRALDAGGV